MSTLIGWAFTLTSVALIASGPATGAIITRRRKQAMRDTIREVQHSPLEDTGTFQLPDLTSFRDDPLGSHCLPEELEAATIWETLTREMMPV